MSDARRYFDLPSPFAMKRGGALVGATLAYETWGTLDGEKSNAILIQTGLSPSAHAASSEADPSPGWWEAMVGPGKYIDTDRWFVVCVNTLGSCKGSTGQASISYLQRRLRIGFSRAARLIDMMEMDGVVSPAAGGKREVLVDQNYFEEVDAQLR